MGILAWIIVGLVTGYFVNVMKKRPYRGLLPDLLRGALGALAGGFIASEIFRFPDPVDSLYAVAVLAACAGALATVAVINALSNRRVASRINGVSEIGRTQ